MILVESAIIFGHIILYTKHLLIYMHNVFHKISIFCYLVCMQYKFKK